MFVDNAMRKQFDHFFWLQIKAMQGRLFEILLGGTNC